MSYTTRSMSAAMCACSMRHICCTYVLYHTIHECGHVLHISHPSVRYHMVHTTCPIHVPHTTCRCGHALYEQGRDVGEEGLGMPSSQARTCISTHARMHARTRLFEPPTCLLSNQALSMGVHESQSLLWERMVLQSKVTAWACMRACMHTASHPPPTSHPSPLTLHTPHPSHPSPFTPLTLHRSFGSSPRLSSTKPSRSQLRPRRSTFTRRTTASLPGAFVWRLMKSLTRSTSSCDTI